MTRRQCFCCECSQTFAGLTVFDDHRTGSYLDIPPHYGRRCRTPNELLGRSYVLKKDGAWHSPTKDMPAHWRIVAPEPDATGGNCP